MFYSESLLAKTGPLARVWLAANLERKLTKQNVLNSDLENNVKDIIGNGQAPMALRLSGQLLLGVARIYSKKARYLLADCSEALLKIKMAFRPGNVDLPGGKQSHTANPNALILPDTITELDLFAPLPEPEDFLQETRAPGRDPTLLDFGTSQLLPDSQTPAQRREKQTLGRLHEDDLDLDLGLEDDEPAVRSTPFGDDDRSVEIGRRAPTPRRDEPSMLLADDLGLDLGLDDNDKTMRESSVLQPQNEEDTVMLGMDDDNMPLPPMDDEIEAANTAALARASAAAEERRQRGSASPLSSIRSSVERDLEETFHLSQNPLQREDEEEVDETMVQAAQRVKRRKVLQQDTEIELRSAQLRQQQEDRSAITKAPSFLPRDPLLLQLMEMQRSGAFVSSIMGDGRMAGWAPELRGISSIEVVRKASSNKRKRGSELPAINEDEREETPRLEIPADEDEAFPPAVDDFALGGNTTLLPLNDTDAAAGPIPSDGLLPVNEDDNPQAPDLYDDAPTPFHPADPFDTTEAPLLHPSQSGPVSLGTQTAVHLLRQHLAPEHDANSAEPPTPSKRVKAEALFTDLCPEETTSRQDATKMFFELLVLGTKDAVKVEQGGEELGGEIRVRGKRGLWGDWAEKGLGATQAVEEGEGEGGAVEGEGEAVEA